MKSIFEWKKKKFAALTREILLFQLFFFSGQPQGGLELLNRINKKC